MYYKARPSTVHWARTMTFAMLPPTQACLPSGLLYKDVLQFECARVLAESQSIASSLNS